MKKNEEIEKLTGIVRNMKLKQDEQLESSNKLQTDITNLTEKYDQTESQKARCEDQLLKVNEKIQNADEAQIEIQRLQEIIRSKNNELNTVNTENIKENDENNTRQKESIFSKLFTPKKNSPGENVLIPSKVSTSKKNRFRLKNEKAWKNKESNWKCIFSPKQNRL